MYLQSVTGRGIEYGPGSKRVEAALGNLVLGSYFFSSSYFYTRRVVLT
jgi:hypothetical protein